MNYQILRGWLLAMAWLLGVVPRVYGQGLERDPSTAQATAPSLANVLDANGRLVPGAEGSFDPTGYLLHQGTDGAPRFARAIEGEWGQRFADPFSPYGVQAIAVHDGNLYAGGGFEDAGGAYGIQGLARWDGAQWTGYPDVGPVRDIVFVGDDLYIAGVVVGSASFGASVYRWEGTQWRLLPFEAGTFSSVYALIEFKGDLYAAGRFDLGGETHFIARWDGTQWQSMDATVTGFTPGAYTLAKSGNDLYVGGEFSSLPSTPGSYDIARWDGTSWHALGSGIDLGSGVDRGVISIALYGGEVFVASDYNGQNAGGGIIQRWDGSNWHIIDNVVRSSATLFTHEGNLFASGGLQAPDGTQHTLLQWDGTAFQPTPLEPPENSTSVLGNTVRQFARIGDNLYGLSGLPLNPLGRLIRWDGTAWRGLGRGISLSNTGLAVRAVAIQEGQVYVGGSFRIVPDIEFLFPEDPIINLARWDGEDWHAVGSALNGPVYALAIQGDDLYVGGVFQNAGGLSNADGIARWDGNQWYNLGAGLGSSVNVVALAVSGNDLYAGGLFSDAGGANNVARWDGAQWHALGTGVEGQTRALAVVGTDLYAGGSFGSAGGDRNANFIARWDGTDWHPLGSGLSNHVFSLTSTGSDLYVGGDFVNAGGVGAHYIARWDGTDWHSLNAALDWTVQSLLVVGEDLYAGGRFSNAGGNPDADGLARWDGTMWHAVGGGLYDDRMNHTNVHALATDNGKLYAGGTFSLAGDGTQTSHFAIYTSDALNVSTEQNDVLPETDFIHTNYPNPFTTATTFHLTLPTPSPVRLRVYDVLGREVGAVVQARQLAGEHELRWDASGLPSGVYFYRLETKQGTRTGSLVKAQ